MNILDVYAGLIWYGSFIFSVVIHEYFHSSCAFKLGDNNLSKEKLLTLNPIPLLKRNKIGTIIFPIFYFIWTGFCIGWAHTPINLEWARRNPKRFVLTVISGPLSNLFILIITTILIKLAIIFGVFQSTINKVTLSLFAGSSQYLIISIILCTMFSMNLIVLFLNLMPFPALDGFAFIILLTKRKYRSILIEKSYQNIYLWISGIVSWIIFLFIFHDLHRGLVRLIF